MRPETIKVLEENIGKNTSLEWAKTFRTRAQSTGNKNKNKNR
jgi:hypothetical protein